MMVFCFNRPKEPSHTLAIGVHLRMRHITQEVLVLVRECCQIIEGGTICGSRTRMQWSWGERDGNTAIVGLSKQKQESSLTADSR